MRIEEYPLGSWAPHEAERRNALIAQGARVSYRAPNPRTGKAGAVVTWPDGATSCL